MNTDRIEKQIVLRAPLARVWNAIADSQQFGTWFGCAIDGPFVAGRRVAARIVPNKVDAEVAKAQQPYEGMQFDFHVERVEPMKLLSFRWIPGSDPHAEDPMTLVELELQDVQDGTRLTVTESGFDRIPLERRAKAFTDNEGGWAMQVRMVEKYLQG